MTRTCTVDGCGRRHFGRGYCDGHYKQWRAHGTVRPLQPRTSPNASRPFPFEPLLALIGRPAEEHLVFGDDQRDRHFANDHDRAMLLGIGERRLYRLRRSGLTVDQAEEFAFRIGVHPAEVWGELWWQHAEQAAAS